METSQAPAEVDLTMNANTFLKSSAAATMITLLVAAGAAFADHNGGGGRDGGGGRNFNGGGNDGGNRSFNMGNSGGSSRSMRFSDGNRSFRSLDGDHSSSSFRTFRNDSDRSSHAFDSDRTGQSFDRSFQFKRDSSDFKFDQSAIEHQVRRPIDRSPQDRELVDREYKQWQNTWSGQKGDGHDHRDWTGDWKDSDRFKVANGIRNDWNDRKGKDRPFAGDWWRDHRHDHLWDFWGDRRFNRPWYWWSWATGPQLGSWFVFGWPTPYYWDYGPGEYINCDNGVIYVNGRWFEPAPVFYDQTTHLLDQAPDVTAQDAAEQDWMPLGVFAVTPDGRNESNLTVQLAVTKDGVIAGTAYDKKSGAAYNIEGTVDKRTQRAVWSYTNDQKQRTIMETSIYNLTQPEATGLVHYSPTDMKVIELVRLQEPGGGAQGAQPTSTAPGAIPPPANSQ